MGRSRSKRTAIVLALMGVAIAAVIGGLLGFGGEQSSPKMESAPSALVLNSTYAALVLNSTYAKSVGYPKTVQAASRQAVTNEKGCSASIGAVYEDAVGKTGLISDLLKCNSPASAAKVLTTFRRSIHVATSISVPMQLGTTAPTASSAPEYIVAWQVGSGVALSAIDVDIAASSNSSESSSGSATSKSIARYQVKVLTDAAVQQNSLYH